MANFDPEFQGEYEKSTRKKYNELAHRMHPDRGGSDESMQALNAAYEDAKKGNFLQLDELYDSNFGRGEENPIKSQLNLSEDKVEKEELDNYKNEQAELVRQDKVEKERLYQEMQRQKDEDYQQHVKDVEANARQHEIDLEKWNKERKQELEQADKERAA